MKSTPLFNLWPITWDEFTHPSLLWQIATLIVCIALGWGLARVLRGTLTTRKTQLPAMRLGVESFARVLSPLMALMLIAIAKPILAQWHQVSLLRVAIPLVASFLLIRLMFYVLRRVFVRGGHAGSFLLIFEKLFAALVWIGVALYITGL